LPKSLTEVEQTTDQSKSSFRFSVKIYTSGVKSTSPNWQVAP
jgi:hypothetical protein